MAHKKHSKKLKKKVMPAAAKVVMVKPLEQLHRKYVSANRKIQLQIRNELDARLEVLDDLDFPDVAIFTLEGRPVEEIAVMLDKSPTKIKGIQREINMLLAA